MGDVNQQVYADAFNNITLAANDGIAFLGSSGEWYGYIIILFLLLLLVFGLIGLIFYIFKRVVK
jgi:lipoprotein signal peptidase